MNSDDVRRHLARRSPIAQPTAMLQLASVKDVGEIISAGLIMRTTTYGYDSPPRVTSY